MKPRLSCSCNQVTRRHKALNGRLSAEILILIVLLAPVWASAGEGASDPFKGLSFGITSYIDYSAGQTPSAGSDEQPYNQFKLTRGYFTVKKTINDAWGMRLTMDLYQDDDGNYNLRNKYLYGEFKAKGGSFYADLVGEAGMGHIPWLDFEEHINPYRCQGTMAIERAGVFNSADLGLNVRGYFGGKLENAKEPTGSSAYDGRYGSWHVGVYNGGGYHATEANENKVLEGRLTFRPLSRTLPGLQASYFGLFGKGNKAGNSPGQFPDYNVNLVMLSYEHPRFVLTAQAFQTEGNAKGKWIATDGSALKTRGGSVFARVPFEGKAQALSLFGRYDYFDGDVDEAIAKETAYGMLIGGLAYVIAGNNIITLAVESTSYDKDAGKKGEIPVADQNLGRDMKVQIVCQAGF